MAKVTGLTGLVVVIVLAVLFVLVNSAQAQLVQINYFDLYTWTKHDGDLILQGDFYAYEDMSLYLGSGSIEYNCETGTFTIDEIVDVPESVTINGTVYTANELIGGIDYIMSELAVYSLYQDYVLIFPEYQPDSLYNFDHPSALVNREVLEGFAQFDHPATCVEYTTYLPVVVN